MEDEPSEAPKAPRGRRGKPKGTPVADMAAEDRALVTRTARRTYEILEYTVERLYDEVVSSDGVPHISSSLASALLSLQKMAAGMLDKHPGLLAEVQAQGTDPETTDDDLEKILEAIGAEEG